MLDLFGSALSAPFWDEGRFSRQTGSWRLGSVDITAGDTIFLSPPADLLERSYGNQAARRISRLEAEITLHRTNPAEEDIYFGIALSSAAGDKTAGIQIQQVGPKVISLALYQDGEADFISQRSVNNVIARLRLDRDRSSGAVTAYYNDSPIGDAMSFDGADEDIPAGDLRQGWRPNHRHIGLGCHAGVGTFFVSPHSKASGSGSNTPVRNGEYKSGRSTGTPLQL